MDIDVQVVYERTGPQGTKIGLRIGQNVQWYGYHSLERSGGALVFLKTQKHLREVVRRCHPKTKKPPA